MGESMCAMTMEKHFGECVCAMRCRCRDLKPDNIGFTEDGTVKIFDFGLCTCIKTRVESTECYKMTGNTGSLRYMVRDWAVFMSMTPLSDSMIIRSGSAAWRYMSVANVNMHVHMRVA